MSGLVHVLLQRKETAWWSDRTALVQGAIRTVSYRELADQVIQLGLALRRRNVRAESVVALALGRSIEHVVGCLACWHAGAGFLPIDLCWPDERIAFVLREVAPSLVLATPEQLPRFRAFGVEAAVVSDFISPSPAEAEQPAEKLPQPLRRGQAVRVIEGAYAGMEGMVKQAFDDGTVQIVLTVFGRLVDVALPSRDVQPHEAVRAVARDSAGPPLPTSHNWPNDLAYVVYTSGSTGQPRGVEVTHANVLPMLQAQVDAFVMNDACRCLWMLSPASDASISDWGTCLLGGGTLFIESDEQLRDPASLTRLMHDRQITHVDLPPPLLPLLSPSQMPTSLRTIVIGGEACPPAIVRHWARSVRVVTVYGPTEATVCTSLCVCDPEKWDEPLLGKALPGVIYLVLDNNQHYVGHVGTGELYVGGRCLARGYRNRRDLISEKFVWHYGQRYYRTGDRVRRRPDGELVFLGRNDRMVKIHGILVEPEEIEIPLRETPGIHEAAVIAQDAGLVAFVSGPSVPPDAEIRSRLSRTLPASMQPHRIVRLPMLPRISTHDIDFAALAELPLEPEPVPTAEGTLGVLLGLANELLGGALDPDAGFLEQGGDSLSLLRLVAAASCEGLSIPPTLLASRCLRDVAASLDGASSGVQTSAAALRDDVARLAEEIGGAHANNAPSRLPRTPPTVLLTGATGSFGSHLLLELLRQTDAEVVCLVRGSGSRAGQERLWQSLAARGLSLRTEERRRVGVIAGDLASPRLGLPHSAWVELSLRVQSVYHAAANANLVLGYVDLCRDNVAGTAEVLRLCAEGMPKWLHFVSTLSVFVASDRGVVRENDDLSATRTAHGGYAQSKFAAEWLLRRAAGKGVTYYRLGLTSPGSRDLLGLFLRGVAKLGCLPACDRSALRLDVTPVDYAARALVYLSLNAADARPWTFHLAGPRSVSLAELAQALYRAGVDLAEVDAATWQRRLSSLQGEDVPAWLALCRAMPGGDAFARFRTFDLFAATDVTFDQGRTLAGLEGSKIACPAIDGALLDRYVRAALRTD